MTMQKRDHTPERRGHFGAEDCDLGACAALVPQSQAALLHQALAEAWRPDRLAAALDAQAARRSA